MQRSLHFSLTAQLSTGCYKPGEVVLAALSQKTQWILLKSFPQRHCSAAWAELVCRLWEEGRATPGVCAATQGEGTGVAEGSRCDRQWGRECWAHSALRVPLRAWGQGALWLGTSPSQLGFAALLFMCCVQTWPSELVLCRACTGAASQPGMLWCVGLMHEVWQCCGDRRCGWGETLRGVSTDFAVWPNQSETTTLQLSRPVSWPGAHVASGVAAVTDSSRLGAGGWHLSGSTWVATLRTWEGCVGWLQRWSLNWNLPLGQFVFFQNKCVGYNQSGFIAGENSTCLMPRLRVQEKGVCIE